MIRMEIRPTEGGKDAELFAQELGDAIAKHSGVKASTIGTTVVLEHL